MNTVKTMMMLAAMTALFLAVGWLIGGEVGAGIAFVFALGPVFRAGCVQHAGNDLLHGPR